MGSANSSRQGWIEGGLITGAALLFLSGLFHIITGIAGFVNRDYFNTANVVSTYPYHFNVTGWSWTHLIAGVILVATGLTLLTGSRMARVLAIAILGLSALANFFFIPFQPFWSLLIIAIDVFAIWAIASSRGRSPMEEYGSAYGMGGRQQAAMGQGAQSAGARSAYQQQSNQRWPENAQNAASRGRQYGDMKAPESMGGQSRDQARQQVSQSSSGMPETAQQAADRARQAGNQGS